MNTISKTVRFYFLNCLWIGGAFVIASDGDLNNSGLFINYLIMTIFYIPLYCIMILGIHIIGINRIIINKLSKTIIYSLLPWLLVVLYEKIMLECFPLHIPTSGYFTIPWYRDDSNIIIFALGISAITGIIFRK